MLELAALRKRPLSPPPVPLPPPAVEDRDAVEDEAAELRGLVGAGEETEKGARGRAEKDG
jgi:hypothetical protein